MPKKKGRPGRKPKSALVAAAGGGAASTTTAAAAAAAVDQSTGPSIDNAGGYVCTYIDHCCRTLSLFSDRLHIYMLLSCVFGPESQSVDLLTKMRQFAIAEFAGVESEEKPDWIKAINLLKKASRQHYDDDEDDDDDVVNDDPG